MWCNAIFKFNSLFYVSIFTSVFFLLSNYCVAKTDNFASDACQKQLANVVLSVFALSGV